ncbi:uncharacterized protein LOC133039372 [Cannabis sativa]|uniref:uncharacterized protein LOC133039372 n=1 Tax=Cannabis sativa TaxID=3483 RepID=UPI0029CA07B2|nr:uncharacterized protein LOC133039372 [Cannabis sativa]
MARFELEKFDGTRDFALWRESLKGILVHQKLSKVLGVEKLLAEKKLEEIAEIEEMSYYTIIMYLSNSVRRKLIAEKTTKGVWNKLEELYIKPSIANKINLLERLYDFRMIYSFSLDDNIDRFKKAIKYGRDITVLEDVLGAHKSKNFELQLEKESKREEVYLKRGRSPEKKCKEDVSDMSNSGIEHDNEDVSHEWIDPDVAVWSNFKIFCRLIKI